MMRSFRFIRGLLLGICCVLLVIAAGSKGGTSSKSADDFDCSQIKIDEEPDWNDGSPGLFPVAPEYADGAYYRNVSAGHLGGSGGIVGRLLGTFPKEARFEATGFSRDGWDISITLTRHANGSKFVSPDETQKVVQFSTRLRQDLPDGHYKATCTVVDADHKDLAGEKIACEFDLPDTTRLRWSQDADYLNGLPDERLLNEYVRRGMLLKGTDLGPMDDQYVFQSVIPYEDERVFAFERSELAIENRGASMVPALVEILKREVPRNPVKGEDDKYGFGFARSVMKILSRIGDARPVPLLVDILDGYHKMGNPELQAAAQDALQKLTFICFENPAQNPYDSVPSLSSETTPETTAIIPDKDAAFTKAATNYRQWLKGEGKDPSSWLTLARQRARKVLAGTNTEEISQSLHFLEGFRYDDLPEIGSKDDNPDLTLARIGQIFSEAKIEGGTLRWNGQLVQPLDCEALTMLTIFGPRARRYMPILLTIARNRGESCSDVENLNEVGGEIWMAELIRKMPIADAALTRYGFTVNTTIQEAGQFTALDPERPKEDAVLLSQCIHRGITRWAGRTFPDTNAIYVWWKLNKNSTQRQWLTDGLEITAARADAGQAEDQVLLRHLIYGLPPDLNEGDWCPPPAFQEYARVSRPEKPWRIDWLKSHKSKLLYDENAGAFRLN